MENSNTPAKSEGSFVNASGQTIKWKRSADDPFKFIITVDGKPIDWIEALSNVKGK